MKANKRVRDPKRISAIRLSYTKDKVTRGCTAIPTEENKVQRTTK